MRTMKLFLFILTVASVGCQSYKYEVHLSTGTHHLITADTEDEALDFIMEQEDSHGTMMIKKIKR